MIYAFNYLANKDNDVITNAIENYSPLNDLYNAISYHTEAWEIVDTTTDTDGYNRNIISKLVVKNKISGLNYDPHIIFTYDGSKINIYPCKSYDNTKEPLEQEGAITNGTNYEDFAINISSTLLNSNPNFFINSLFYDIIISDYTLTFRLYYAYDSYGVILKYFANMVFSVLDTIDKDNSGMYITVFGNSDFTRQPDNEFLFADGIWYGNTDTGIWTSKFTKDIDKSVGFRHYVTPQGATSASPISFFVDTNNDTSINEWKFVGFTKDNFGLCYDWKHAITNIKNEDGENKLCYFIQTPLKYNDYAYYALVDYEDNVKIMNILN